ncbi:MAG: RNA polymerase subunit sigma [Rhodospirillaceae bacterium]|nr:RNA polymerase subunit sigma [Rhodospirillaceae bacterium]
MHSYDRTSDIVPYEDSDLADLLQLVAEKRDKAAFARLFDHFAPRVKGFLRRNGTPEAQLDDLVQEVMIKVWRYSDRFDPKKGKTTTWIFTITRNVRIDLLRKENRPEPDANDPMLVPTPVMRSDDAVYLNQSAMRIADALDELPKEQAVILRLSFFEGKSHGEIAEHIGLPLGTVKSRIRLAFDRLRNSLTELEL